MTNPLRQLMDATGHVLSVWKHPVSPGDPYWSPLDEALRQLDDVVTQLMNKANARNRDPDTSHKAAAKVLQMNDRRQAVLDLFTKWLEMTDEELVIKYQNRHQQSASGLRSRRAELVVMGHLRDSGKRRRNTNGNRCVVWTLA